MKILLATGIYPPESGGPATYTRDLALALQARGHEVSVIAYGRAAPADGTAGVSVTRVSRSGGAFVRYLRYAWQAFKLARRADLVYVQGPVSEGLPATLAACLAGRPLVMKVVGDYAWEMAQGKGERELLPAFLQTRHQGVIGWYEKIERRTSRRAMRVITPSRYLKSVVEAWGVPAQKIDVIKNAVHPLPPAKSREEERRAFGVMDNVACLSVVRAVPWKGVAELIRWWKELPATHELVIAGDGPELENWKRLAGTEGIADRVRFVGRLDRQELARWYQAADAFLLHSGYEGYPHVVAEAAMTGVPCLVSDQGGQSETQEDFGPLVRVLPYQDRAAWVAAVREVGARSSASVAPPAWTHERMVERTEAVLKEVTGERAPGIMQSVMVSYDRELLDSSTEAFRRVASLAREGVTIRALVISHGERDTKSEGDGLRVFGFAGSVLRRMRLAVRDGIRSASAMPGRTVVTAQDPFAAGLVGYVISRWTNNPLEIQEHGDFFSGAWVRERWQNRIFAIFGRWLVRRAERVRAVSERVKAHLVANGVSAERIEVIPVAQDLAPLFLRPLASPASVFRIVAPCRWTYQKGLDVLLTAAKELHDRGITFELRIIGRGPEEQNLRGLALKLGLQDRVKFMPWTPMDKLWDEADLFVLSSRWEGWGRTVVEAMAAGVPIVATETGCVGSFFRPNEDGLAVSPSHPHALAEAMERLMKDTALRERLRHTARERAREFLSRDVLHDRQRSGWRSALRAPSSVSCRFDLWVAAFLAFIVLSRAASVALFHHGLANREWGFYTLVEHWFQGFGYSFAPELGCLSAYRSPGYLFFLTALYTFFKPENTLAQAIVQNLFVVGALWLVYAVGKRLVGKRAALTGGFLMAAYPYTFYHYTQYYHTFLSSFFLLLTIWFLFRLAETKRLAFSFGAGLSIGALAYVQGTILPTTPFLAAWLVWMLWPNWKRAVAGIAIMAVASAGLIAPWTYRNWKAFHHFVPLTTDLGHALFKANNEDIFELTKRGYPQEIVDVETVSSTNPYYKQYRMPAELEAELKRDSVFRESVAWTAWHPTEPGRLGHCARSGELDEYAFNQYWLGLAKNWLREHEATEGWKLQLQKLKTFWQPALFPSVKTGAAWSFAASPAKVWLARSATTAASALVIFGGWLGLLIHLRRRNRYAVVPLILLVIYSFLHTFFAGYTKYRIPLDNLLAPYAGWCLLALARWIQWREQDVKS